MLKNSTTIKKFCVDVGEESILPPYNVGRLREADSFPYISVDFYRENYIIYFTVCKDGLLQRKSVSA